MYPAPGTLSQLPSIDTHTAFPQRMNNSSRLNCLSDDGSQSLVSLWEALPILQLNITSCKFTPFVFSKSPFYKEFKEITIIYN